MRPNAAPVRFGCEPSAGPGSCSGRWTERQDRDEGKRSPTLRILFRPLARALALSNLCSFTAAVATFSPHARVGSVRPVQVSVKPPTGSSQLPHVRVGLSITPAMNELAIGWRRAEIGHNLNLSRGRPAIAFDLAEHDVGGADSDKIPDAERRRHPGAAVAQRFKQCDAAVFVARPFSLRVHKGSPA